MNELEQRLATLERLARKTQMRLNALETVVASAIVTSERPQAIASRIRSTAEAALTQHLFDAAVTDDVREFVRQQAELFARLAEHEAQRRRGTPPASA